MRTIAIYNKMKAFVSVTIMLALGLQCLAYNLPANIQKCKYGDGECIAKMANMFFPMTKQAIPELDLPVGDPMAFKNKTITGTADSSRPIYISCFFKDGAVHGLSRFIVKTATGFEKDPRNSKIKLSIEVPIASIVGNYILNGKFLLFPLKGEGFSNLTVELTTIKATFDTSVKTIDGEDYLHVKKVHTDANSAKPYLDIANYFPNKEINDNIRAFADANQPLIFEELRPSLSRSYGKVITPYIRKLFMAMPYRKFFAEE